MVSLICYCRKALHVSEEYMCTFLSLSLKEYRAKEKDPSLFTLAELESIGYFLGKPAAHLRNYKDYSLHDQEEVEKLIKLQRSMNKSLGK